VTAMGPWSWRLHPNRKSAVNGMGGRDGYRQWRLP
jgi:hypothetical protein